MQTYHCDGCGKIIGRNELRYTVRVDVRAAYDQIEVHLTDLVRDHRAEILALIEQLENKGARELEESVYAQFTFDLCPACQRAYLKDPLRFQRGPTTPPANTIIEEFLRSLRPPEKE